jgi:hypothetical protein
MKRPAILGLAMAIVALFPSSSRAQDASTQTSSPSTTATAARSASVPTGASASQPSQKVWTNEDMSELRSSSEISSIGRNGARNQRQAGRAAPASHGNGTWYREQITKLKTQLASLDAQIGQLRAAINGAPTGDTKTSTRPALVKGGTWQEELAKAQAKRDDVSAQIDALRDDARHNGVAANTLP